MGGPSSFYAMLAIAGFLTAIWGSGKISGRIGISSIVLEVAVGVVLGPQIGKLIPGELSECMWERYIDCDRRTFQEKVGHKGYKYCDLGAYLKEGKYTTGNQAWYEGFWGNVPDGVLTIGGDKGGTYCLNKDSPSPACSRRLLDEEAEFELAPATPRQLAGDKKGKTESDNYSECIKDACDLDRNNKCAYVPDVFTLVGHTGVAMMIFESGMHFDFEQAKTVGPWACAVAVLGTFLPLISGALLSLAYGFDFIPDAMSAGTALAPTSVGIALKLLHEARALQTYFGQAVMTAAFVDDVLSLILFSIIFSLGDDMTFMSFFPLIMGCIFMVVAIIAAVKVWPPFITWLFEKIPEYKPNSKVTTHDEVMWFLMFLTLCVYAQITHICGTHLWGCFIGGMSFATQHHAHHVWVKQVKRLTCWFLRIFFGCTLAWSIPVKELFSIGAFLKGSLMGIGPCIATKVLCGPFMGAPRWVIGWAMVGRAEFAYFIAILAKSTGKMAEELFAILVWALLYATIFAPLIFRKVLARYMAKLEESESRKSTESTEGAIVTKASVDSMGFDKNEEVAIEQMIQNFDHTASSMAMRMARRNLSEGHLPDFEAEKELEEEQKMKVEHFKLQITSGKQDIKIVELKDKIEKAREELQRERDSAVILPSYDSARGSCMVAQVSPRDEDNEEKETPNVRENTDGLVLVSL